MTTTLAANGAQAGMLRGVALMTAGLGVIPSAMMLSSAGPDSASGRLVSLVVSAFALAFTLAWLWRRGHWPTRFQSILFIVGSCSGVAAVALVQSNPASGFTATMAFAALSGYCALVHTTRYTCYLLVAVAPVVGVLTARLSIGDPVWAASLVATLVVVNVAIAMMCHTVVQLLEITVLQSDINLVTGLLNRQAFFASVGAMIARSRGEDRYLMVAVASLDNFSMLTALDGVPGGYRVRVAAAQTLREIARRDAVVGHIEEADFVIADSFPSADAESFIERVLGAIAATRPRTSASVGYVCTPLQELAGHLSDAQLDEIIAAAMGCVGDARRAGGNQFRQGIWPPDTTPDDETS